MKSREFQCDDLWGYLVAYTAGDLCAGDLPQLAWDHMGSCSSCQAFQKQLFSIMAALPLALEAEHERFDVEAAWRALAMRLGLVPTVARRCQIRDLLRAVLPSFRPSHLLEGWGQPRLGAWAPADRRLVAPLII